jgi:hypothetical protein
MSEVHPNIVALFNRMQRGEVSAEQAADQLRKWRLARPWWDRLLEAFLRG